MTKYLQNIIGRFEELKQGISNNYEKWRLMPDTPQSIDGHIVELLDIDGQIADIKKKLSDKQAEARRLKEEKKTVVGKIEKRAMGLHADEEDKLEEYKIKVR